MAVGYGNYKNRTGMKIVYFLIALAIVAAAAAVLFYPFGKDKKIENPPAAASVQPATGRTAPAETKQAAVVQPSADVNNLAGGKLALMLSDAQKCIAEGKIISARNTLNDALNMAMDDALRQDVKNKMQKLAEDWLFSKMVHFGDELCSMYKVQSGDLLSSIAARHKVPYQLLMRINNIQSEKSLQAGQNIKVVQGPFHAVAYLSSFTMDLYLQNIYVKSYKIGTGKSGYETPMGLWRVKAGGKLVKPIWTDPDTGRTYHASDPDYPLGSGWIALEGIDSSTKPIQGIAIHGTNEEATIGTKSSRGCIRLYNGDLKEVYDLLEPVHSELRIAK